MGKWEWRWCCLVWGSSALARFSTFLGETPQGLCDASKHIKSRHLGRGQKQRCDTFSESLKSKAHSPKMLQMLHEKALNDFSVK